jgi:hypothetical protein
VACQDRFRSPPRARTNEICAEAREPGLSRWATCRLWQGPDHADTNQTVRRNGYQGTKQSSADGPRLLPVRNRWESFRAVKARPGTASLFRCHACSFLSPLTSGPWPPEQDRPLAREQCPPEHSARPAGTDATRPAGRLQRRNMAIANSFLRRQESGSGLRSSLSGPCFRRDERS